MHKARTIIESIATDWKMVSYGLLLLALHIVGILLLYDVLPEFDILPHFWFGFVLSEYSSKGAASVGLQVRLSEKLRKHGWAGASLRKADFLLRLAGFLLIGGLFWEWLELFFSPLIGRVPDSFFTFPITLRNIDGAIDVSLGIVGATAAFLTTRKLTKPLNRNRLEGCLLLSYGWKR